MNPFIRTFALVGSLLSGGWLALNVQAQVLPLEIRQDAARYNVSSTNGLPLSNVRGTPPGSNGRAPAEPPGTPGQFQGLVNFGAIARPVATQLNPALNYAANAENLDLPRISINGQVVMVMTRARVAAPVVSRAVSFLFGQVVPLPDTDEYGVALSRANTNMIPSRPAQSPESYWHREPYSPASHTNADYYYSPHADAVFAVNAGVLRVPWRRTVSSTNANPPAGVTTIQIVGVPYVVWTNQYIVSASPVKDPQLMYWTERSFVATGKPVSVPSARVGAVNVVYNHSFPERVASEVVIPGAAPITTSNTLAELRTLWVDQTGGQAGSQIRAYNQEGRVFMELLGDVRESGRRAHLGFEIVEVIRQPAPLDVQVELGDRLTAHAGGQPGDSDLFPEPLLLVGQGFTFLHNPSGSPRPAYYASRETINQNDLQVHWLREGLEGLRWPLLFVRYQLVWPRDVGRYSHYVRPLVASEIQAQDTAVALPTDNAPFIAYQDPLDQPRGKLTKDFAYYSFLEPTYPAHRALLRFTSGEFVRFERVFSWLDQTLRDPSGGLPSFATSVATNLTAWTNGGFHWPDEGVRPRLATATVNVGQRLTAPLGETGAGSDTNYLAGYIRTSEGDLFLPQAYLDPFSSGFAAASQSAIIPVNSRPGNDHLEVWWFRKNQVNVGQGFKPSFWPSVIARYTVRWPSSASEIILASDQGSGALPSLEATGTLYFQNDRSLAGYNPNEEHALMQGGQVFALRDDLNLTTGPNYTSEPFVLLNYREADGRPAVRVFRVLREKPESGLTFDYRRVAGSILQPPMPLPLLEKPLAPNVPGQPPKNLNTEITGYFAASSARSTATGSNHQTIVTTTRHFLRTLQPVALQNPLLPSGPSWLLPLETGSNSLTGPISQIPPLELRPWSGEPSSVPLRWRFAARLPGVNLATPSAGLLIDRNTGTNWPTLVTEFNLAEQYVEVQLTSSNQLAARESTTLLVRIENPLGNAFAGFRLATEPLPLGIRTERLLGQHASFTFQDRKGNTWFYRGPHDADSDPSVVMQFYYRTLPGFHFPSLELAGQPQPPAGTITPYLRSRNPDGSFAGDPVYGNRLNPQQGDGNPLGITYHPRWPENTPVLQMAETLTTPKRGLPAVRGQTSLEILYQQSQATGGETNESAVLHDPTREKAFALGEPENGSTLDGLPSSVKSQTLQGKTYFPNLPPHLAERLFFDPNRGAFGALVFKGQFVDAALGDKYIQLNVLGQSELAELRALCLDEDPRKQDWDAAIDGLATTLETFIENPAKPRTFVPSSPEVVGAAELARIDNDDVAVDSYALSATGPGTGFLSLLAGNGRAFTPDGDPVSIQIIKVVNTLYRGEVNIVESSNPLSEKLTLQQVVDLAGKSDEFNFEWKIASPVDGLPPAVYRNTPVTLVADGAWSHLRYPLPSDAHVGIGSLLPTRLSVDTYTTVSPVSQIRFTAVERDLDGLRFTPASDEPHGLVAGNQVVVRQRDGTPWHGTVAEQTTSDQLHVRLEDASNPAPSPETIQSLEEQVHTNEVQSVLFRAFVEPPGNYSQFWLSLDLDAALGAIVSIDGQVVVRANTGRGDSSPTTPPAGLRPLSHAYRLSPADLAGGVQSSDGVRYHQLSVELVSGAYPGSAIPFNLRLEAFAVEDVTVQQWLPLDSTRYPEGVRAILGGTADVRSLADNYLIMRYQPRNPGHASYVSDGQGGNRAWSQWTAPQLAEGWIKRVLKGINPFNQRITDLFNNSVNTDVSIVAQAGQRWEGDVALNLESINNAGLIEIYETVLGRGKMLSINNGINYGPANDALLLAAGYLNDLYMVLGNEAWADASNPTIGIGTKDNTYGAIATSLFSFRGQLPSLLEEELALLRGRDDFLLPGVELRPVYNRMIWNYTRGIDAGEVVYALNYNVLDQNSDGVVNADDARRLYPQGHGDAYGHFLTALKGYYSLLMDTSFDWVPRIEAVTVLGKPVSVDYQDERKFAAAAGSLARAGKQVFDLTWRRDYQSVKERGWSHFAATKANTSTRSVPTTRYWGLDHWAARTGQGAYLNWVVGNAILPDRDPDPAHAGGIQQIDRTTVPELKELPALGISLQTALDNAEAGHTPLGLPASSIPFDLDPNSVVGGAAAGATTHFEQIYARAKRSLNNAVVGFDDAKDVTRLMRSEEDSLAEFRTLVNKQELAFTNSLIELYGTPYPEDIGPGKTYRTGFAGPDTVHYMYIDNRELDFVGPRGSLLDPKSDTLWRIDTQTFTQDWVDAETGTSDFNFIQRARSSPVDGNWDPSAEYLTNRTLYVEYNLASHGFFQKPPEWTGRRASPGKIQQAISDIVKSRNAAYAAFYWADAAKYDLDWALQAFDRKQASFEKVRDLQRSLMIAQTFLGSAKAAYEIADRILDEVKSGLESTEVSLLETIPRSLIVGVSSGGDMTAPIRGTLKAASSTAQSVIGWSQVAGFSVIRALEAATEESQRIIEFQQIAPEEWNQGLRDITGEIRDLVYGMNNQFMTINQRLQELDDAQRKYRALIAEGDRIQQERQIFRQRAAAVIQGFRTRDAAFRIFRNEKLERYKALFDLAAQYAYLTAQAYDYETGLLHTDQGAEFLNRIIRSRALGVVQGGEPQFAGSNTGDPGLSSTMAELAADWSVLKGRLGFNNPDAYGTTISLRTENFRILPGTNGATNWKEVLNQARHANLLDDPDVRRYCLQMDGGNGLPVPGLVLEFSTMVAPGVNLFGHPLAAGDHTFSSSSFATKIHAAGVALEGYQGMDAPSANSGAISGAGGVSPSEPDLAFLDANHLSASPYVYLIPVGVDSLRSPPLGDVSEARSWSIDDVAIPLPFNVGGSPFSTSPTYQSADSLSEQPFAIRKHQAFRPVPSASFFSTSIYQAGGGLARSQYTNNRLIGRSVWNSKWKLVIPGQTLLNNPNEGLERFIRTVQDIKLHLVTYSYAGN